MPRRSASRRVGDHVLFPGTWDDIAPPVHCRININLTFLSIKCTDEYKYFILPFTQYFTQFLMLWSYNHHSPCAVGVYYAAAGAFPGFDSGGLRDHSVCSEGAVEKKKEKGQCSKRICSCLPSTPHEMERFTDRLIQVIAVRYLCLLFDSTRAC